MMNNAESIEVKNDSSKSQRRWKKDRSHIIVLPGTNPELFKCKVCEKTFRNRKGKCYHDSCVTGVKPYKCNICEQTFVKRSHFEYHERAHSGYKPFKCALCEKAFPQRNKLNRHMNSHKNEKDFACEACGKRYSKKEDLNSHLTLHTGQRPHVCQVCGKSFGVLTNFNRHVRTHSKEKPFACEVCKKSFKDRSLLIRHKKIHGKERPFSCADCNRPFLSKSELTRHLVIHTDVKAFNCTYCSTIFRRKDNLDRHIRHHHADGVVETNKNEKEESNKATPSQSTVPKPKSIRVKKIPKTPKITKSLAKDGESTMMAELTRGNSRDQINSRLDSRGYITPVIRAPGEFSNAVSVINGPIVASSILSKSVELKSPEVPISEKKTYKYTEPIPLDDVVTINRRIEEKLYPETSSLSNNYFFYGKNSSTDQSDGAGLARGKSSESGASCLTAENSRLDNDETSEISRNIDNFVPTIRINDDSQPFHETISIHHWRRRTAELIRLSRSGTDK